MMVVKRAAIPSVVAPVRRRPMTRNQALDCFRTVLLSRQQRFLLQRDENFRRVAAQSLAEESRRGDAHDRKRMSIKNKDEPTIFGSPP